MKKYLTMIILGASIISLTTTALPIFNQTVLARDVSVKENNNSDIIVKVNGQTFYNVSLSEDIKEAAGMIEEHFYVDPFGNIRLKGTPEELSEKIGVSLQEAELMYQAVQDFPNLYDRGPVGFRFNLGPQIRGMGGWAAAAFATGYAGFYLKQFAVTPATAGAVGVLSAAIGWNVKYAVENYWTSVNVTIEVPFVTMVFPIDIP